jgi:acetyl-CoA acyltransferase
VLAWQRETGANLANINVHGGAIALGHPWAPAAPGS